jgi:hypothetical protein
MLANEISMVPLRPTNIFFLFLLVLIGPLVLLALITHGIILEQVHRFKRWIQRVRSARNHHPWQAQSTDRLQPAATTRNKRRPAQDRERNKKVEVFF